MTASSDKPPDLGLRLFIHACASAFLSGLFESCTPAIRRIATPMVCPPGTVGSAVIAEWRRSARGSEVLESTMRCLDADGGSIEASRGLAYLVLFAGTFVLLLVARGVYAAWKRARHVPTVAMLVLTAVYATGCTVGTMTAEEFEAAYPRGDGRMFSRGVADSALAALPAVVGKPYRVHEIRVVPSQLMVDVVDAADPNRGDTFTYVSDDESFTERPEPIRAHDLEGSQNEPFDARPGLLATVSTLVRRAEADLALERGVASSVTCTQQGGSLRLRVYVTGARRSGSIEYDASGRELRRIVE